MKQSEAKAMQQRTAIWLKTPEGGRWPCNGGSSCISRIAEERKIKLGRSCGKTSIFSYVRWQLSAEKQLAACTPGESRH